MWFETGGRKRLFFHTDLQTLSSWALFGTKGLDFSVKPHVVQLNRCEGTFAEVAFLQEVLPAIPKCAAQ